MHCMHHASRAEDGAAAPAKAAVAAAAVVEGAVPELEQLGQ